jgi:hypothetical protein
MEEEYCNEQNGTISIHYYYYYYYYYIKGKGEVIPVTSHGES